MSGTTIVSAEKYFVEAERMLEQKDSMAFMENISYASLLSSNETKLYSKVIFFKAKGLFLLREYDKALNVIEEALRYNNGDDRIRLLKYRGLIATYRGLFKEAINIYERVLVETDNIELQTEIYINLSATYLAMYRTYEEDKKYLDEASKWLKATDTYFELLKKDVNKKLICINYGEYYYLFGNIDKAIEMQEQAIQYCQEGELPEVYNNLAELYVMIECLSKAEEYLREVELLGEKYHNNLEIAKGFYTTSKIYLLNEEYLRAVDSLYMALDFFIDAEALPYAFKCFCKILEVSKQFDNMCVNSLQKGIKGYFKNTLFYEKM